jgi:hypothetical protein
MSSLYHHLLIPPKSDFVPKLEEVVLFIRKLEDSGALPSPRKFRALTFTGGTRLVGRNPKTGEEYYGPEFEVNRFPELQPAVDSVGGRNAFDLSVEGKGPTAIPPFDIYSARVPETPWGEPYSYRIHCRLRTKADQVHWSAYGSKCGENPDEPGIIELGSSGQPIQSSGPAFARFWIEFVIGDYLMPVFTDTPEILNPRLVATANEAFGIQFTQGCRVNDD